jgi:hypothetical protein
MNAKQLLMGSQILLSLIVSLFSREDRLHHARFARA